ncbi:MAG: shikimate dehydrogenase [Nitrospirae bacterium]|nr:shikimate dehydrogenase [Nitrospirota bacterium]
MIGISGTTVITGIFGHPVSHTLSPAMHNAAFDALGLNWRYLPFHVTPERLGEAVAGIRALGLRGVNVTVPHKEAVMPFLDRIDDEAGRIGAVNTIVNDDGVLTGYNTDGLGFVQSLKELGVTVGGRRIIMLGAGGAARSVAFALLASGAASIHIINRTVSRASSLADELNRTKQAVTAAGEAGSLSGFDIMVNTTSLGLHAEDALPVDPAHIHNKLVVCDLIYNPAETPLLAAARKHGAKTVNGLGMLLWQGAVAFRLWTGAEPPVDAMRRALEAGLAARR